MNQFNATIHGMKLNIPNKIDDIEFTPEQDKAFESAMQEAMQRKIRGKNG